MWLGARELMESIMSFPSVDEGNVDVLIRLLDTYKERMLALTKNPGKSPTDRVKISNPQGVFDLGGDKGKIQLDALLCNEAQVLSDAFQLNESVSMELLLTAEGEVRNYDGFNRGLVAVICYYSSHRLFAEALCSILSWTREDLPQKMVEYIQTNFVNTALLKQLIQIQATFTVVNEFHVLMQPHINGLGAARHQSLLRTHIEETRKRSAEAAYLLCVWAREKSKDFVAELFPILKSFTDKDKLQAHHVTAWTCLLVLLNSKCLSQSNRISAVVSECQLQLGNEASWSDVSMFGSVCLAFAVAVQQIAIMPSEHNALVNLSVDVTRFLDKAIHYMCFHFLRFCVIPHEGLRSVPQQIVVVDRLLKGFVLVFPSKMMELMRSGADELHHFDEIRELKGVVNVQAHNEHFRVMLSAFSELYRMDQRQAAMYKLSEATLTELSQEFSVDGNVQLCQFLEIARRPQHSVHAVAYLQVLRDVCITPETASLIFDLFQNLPPNSEGFFSWSSFASALRDYERYFRQNSSLFMPGSAKAQADATILSEEELAGLLAWTQLAEKVARLDDEACQVLADDRSWALVEASCSVIAARVPLVLKGALLRMLAAVSRLPNGANRVWSALSSYSICSFNETGKLVGLIQELEERECAEHSYECSLGMAHLLRALFAQPNVPETSAPYLQFCANSVLSQLSSRSYKSTDQMWELAEVCMDSLYWVLLHAHVDGRSVSRREPHVAILLQLLNDTPLFRTVGWVLCEDFDAANFHSGSVRVSADAALSALRLLHAAVTRMASLRTAIRAADADAILSSVEALMLSPLPQSPNQNILNLLFHFVSQHDELPVHALLCMQIIREICSVRPSLQGRIVDMLRSVNEMPARLIRTAYSILCPDSIVYTVEEVMLKDNYDFADDTAKVRGETARLLLETLADAMETDPSTPNLCYLMFAINLHDTSSGTLYANAAVAMGTGLKRLLEVVDAFVRSENPFSLPFSALLQPTFRLLRCLVSIDSPKSPLILRHIRSEDIVYRLATSPFVGLHAAAATDEESTTTAALSDMIAGNILHLSALEISSLLVHGHFSEPQRLLRALLETVEGGADVGANQTAMEQLPSDRNVLFSLLQNAQTAIPMESAPPLLDCFDTVKLQKVLDCSLRSTTWGIPLYDIEHIHFLLKREIIALGIEDAAVPTKEMEVVLEWSTACNDRWLLESAHCTLLSGCTALLRVIALVTPMPFFSHASQVQILRDASFELSAVTSCHGGELATALCRCLLSVCKAICTLLRQEECAIEDKRSILAQVLSPIFELMVQPGERALEAKIALYSTARRCIAACYRAPEEATADVIQKQKRIEDESWLFRPTTSAQDDPIRALLDKFTQELIGHLSSDISDLPLEFKVHPLMLLSDLLWEDSLGTRRISNLIARSGLVRYMVESLGQLDVDFVKVAASDSDAVTQSTLFRSLMLCLTRVSLVDAGWISLVEVGTVEELCRLQFMHQPPNELFLDSATVNRKGTPGFAFGQCLDLILHFIVSMCSNSQWKRLIGPILDLIRSQCELLCQLTRAGVTCKMVDCSTLLLQLIQEKDEEAREAVNASASFRMLLNRKTGKENTVKIGSKISLPSAKNSPALPMRNFPSNIQSNC